MKLRLRLYATELGPRRAFASQRPCFVSRQRPISTKASSLPLLDREWMLPDAAVEIHKISVSPSHPISFSNDPRPTRAKGSPSFYLVRDDLLHPLVNGNKARKLDALLPILQGYSATHVVTCGGCQSAHAAALAVACAERGIRAHLLLRGEQPAIPTGYNLVSLMYGNTTYVSRSQYAQREEMLNKHADLVAGNDGCVVWIDNLLKIALADRTAELDGRVGIHLQSESVTSQKRIVVVNEGAGDVAGLLGVIRLVRYISEFHLFGREQHLNIVVDAGTGTTAVGLALGALCLGLPWRVSAVMLADTIERYKEREKCLISSFKRIHQLELLGQTLGGVDDSLVHWVERLHPRKDKLIQPTAQERPPLAAKVAGTSALHRFGKVLKGEIELCRQIAVETGILVDPVYTLAAWEHSVRLSLGEVEKDDVVVMLHTGGTLGMFGLAQRYTDYFINAGKSVDNLL